ncbi:MAG: hypothetical protein ACYCTB_11145 [bacterium]
MRIYKRGNIYWCEFQADKKVYRYSCKTKDKALAREVATAINADAVRNKFDIPAKYKAEKTFSNVWEEYLKINSSNAAKWKNYIAKQFFNKFSSIKNVK